MMTTHTVMLSLVLALYYPFCTAKVKPTMPAWDAPLAELWQSPDGVGAQSPSQGPVATRDLFYGPWGPERAPDPGAVYTFVERKQQGTNPGITVRDPHGREWHVKQPPHTDQGAEGPIEVALSRVLSAVGYHQPPVYFLPSLTVKDADGTHVEPGGRFRLTDKSIKAVDTWSWQQNPFVGTRPYQGLLVILMLFNSSDIKNENNILYEVKEPGAAPRHWYVVRDLGTALGETGRLAPLRGDPDIFERQPFILGVKDGVVRFNYHGWHQELLREIDPLDVAFAVDLLQQLTDQQWRDAFRAGGYQPRVAGRFITQLHQRIDEARRVAGEQTLAASPSR
ncbi:MAG TPA: hypothetical protein VKE96_15135 [Vicinamibacterales bacterium]|nr:hypothetical protein [Vicinamibacterales bacterium]